MRRWFLAALLAPPARAALSCVDEDGSPVDWWFLYKQPRWADKGRQEPVGNGEGDTYVYASSARNYEWKVGATVVNSSTCLLGKNLEGIYDGTVENFVLTTTSCRTQLDADFGHSKGWFAWDGDGAMGCSTRSQSSRPRRRKATRTRAIPSPATTGTTSGRADVVRPARVLHVAHAGAAQRRGGGDAVRPPVGVRLGQGAAGDDDDGTATLPNVSAVIGGGVEGGSITTAITAGWGELTLFGKSASLGEDMLNSLISPTLDETLDSQARAAAAAPAALAHIAPAPPTSDSAPPAPPPAVVAQLGRRPAHLLPQVRRRRP